MARFCFVSNALVTHCDMGGMSFLRTAEELRRRGHDVRWVFSPLDNKDMEARAAHTVTQTGVPAETSVNLVLVNNENEVFASTFSFEAYLRYHAIDCVVVDRLCAVAPFAAHRAQVPWAAVGTDGRDWCYAAPAMLPKDKVAGSPGMGRLGALLNGDGFPRPSVDSHWATSPFLNICFFPKAYFCDGAKAGFPAHSHFLGSGPAPAPDADRSDLLITFGNTFPEALRWQVLTALRPYVEAYGLPVTLLTGKAAQAKMLRAFSRALPHVTVKEWAPYDEAYRGANVVIGHGGYSQIWYSIWAATPLLAVPFLGDQWYAGCQLERLKIGRASISHGGTLRGSVTQPRLRLDEQDFAARFTDLLSDPDAGDRILQLNRMMRGGGGVAASASLLERLAHERSPVEACVDHCCC